MFRASSDVSELSAAEIVAARREGLRAVGRAHGARRAGRGGRRDLLSRADELREALEAARSDGGHAIAALMVTDIVERATTLLVAGEVAAVERAFGERAEDGAITLPGVMSRKKQVAPKILAA